MSVHVSSVSESFQWQGILPISEILTRLSGYINQKVKIVLDEGVHWKKKVFQGILESVGTEGIRLRILGKIQTILNIPYHEFDDGNPESPGIKDIYKGKTHIYHRVGISYTDGEYSQ